MIRTPTVFVVGAGGSVPYGFPAGEQLAKDIASNLLSKDGIYKTIVDSGIPEHEVGAFAQKLQAAAPPSIDDFLGAHTEFNKVGKACIAKALARYEREDALHGWDKWQTPDRRWLKYLTRLMRETGPRARPFEQNRLSVITFNFDRLIERAIFLELQDGLNLASTGAAELCRRVVPVVHIHGDLGACSWLCDSGEFSRPFDDQMTIHQMKVCGERIKIVSDDLSDDDANVIRAREWLMAADRIVFIGFSFDNTNVTRLDLDSILGKAKDGQTVQATTFGLDPGKRLRLKARFKNIDYSSDDALAFLKEQPWLHD